MSLPKWVEEEVEFIDTKRELKLKQALAIAWEALENTPADKLKNVWYVQKCKEAMHRIEALGGRKS